jgi:16S rRNA (guanine966-N2)-methyltransferase
VKSEVATFLKRDAGRYDLIFADPPYWKYHGDKDHVTDLLKSGLLPPRLAPGGWLVAEISSNQKSPEANDFTLVDRREYGSSAILLYQSSPGLQSDLQSGGTD